MKYIAAGISFVIIWFAVAVLTGLVLAFIFRPERPAVLNWINLPGTILGFFAGLHSAKASIRIANKKKED